MKLDQATTQKLVWLLAAAAMAAMSFYFSSDPTVSGLLMSLASLAIGSVLVKRPGDEGPAPPTKPSL